MFGLQVVAPGDRMLPSFTAGGENLDGFGVTAAHEEFFEHEVETTE